MKFYDCATAPSPRRVRIFLAEKNITVPTVQVDLRNNQQLTPAFRAINPDATVPSLELDDGTRINDAVGNKVSNISTVEQPTPPAHRARPTDPAGPTRSRRPRQRKSIAARGRVEGSASGAFITATEAGVLVAGVTAAGPASSPAPSSPSR